MRIINETKAGNCQNCSIYVEILDKGNGKLWLCEKCYYELGYQFLIKRGGLNE